MPLHPHVIIRVCVKATQAFLATGRLTIDIDREPSTRPNQRTRREQRREDLTPKASKTRSYNYTVCKMYLAAPDHLCLISAKKFSSLSFARYPIGFHPASEFFRSRGSGVCRLIHDHQASKRPIPPSVQRGQAAMHQDLVDHHLEEQGRDQREHLQDERSDDHVSRWTIVVIEICSHSNISELCNSEPLNLEPK
jgi:hypothetical protein